MYFNCRTVMRTSISPQFSENRYLVDTTCKMKCHCCAVSDEEIRPHEIVPNTPTREIGLGLPPYVPQTDTSCCVGRWHGEGAPGIAVRCFVSNADDIPPRRCIDLCLFVYLCTVSGCCPSWTDVRVVIRIVAITSSAIHLLSVVRPYTVHTDTRARMYISVRKYAPVPLLFIVFPFSDHLWSSSFLYVPRKALKIHITLLLIICNFTLRSLHQRQESHSLIFLRCFFGVISSRMEYVR